MKDNKEKALPPLIEAIKGEIEAEKPIRENDLPPLIASVKGEIEAEKPIREWLEYANMIFTNNGRKFTNLKDFVTQFYDSYRLFKEDYDKIEKLNLGNLINVLYFNEDEKSCYLELLVEGKQEGTIKPKGFKYLTIFQRDGQYHAFFTDSQNYNRKIIEITDVDPSVLKGYLDVFRKHKEIFNLYKDFRNKPELVFGNHHSLYVLVHAWDDALVDGLEAIEFIIQNFPFLNTYYCMHIWVDLLNGINIDFDKCYVTIDEHEETLVGKSLYTDALNTLQFPTSRLTDEYDYGDLSDEDEEIDTNRK